MKKVMLIYPPGKFYQRGEDRSQGNVEQSTATTMRAPNDLGYAASTLQARGYSVFLRDYQTENLSLSRLIEDFKQYDPDAMFMSVTNATIFKDIAVVAALKDIKKDFAVLLKGAIFFNPHHDLLAQLDLGYVDYLLGMESEFSVAPLLDAHFNNAKLLSSIPGILYKEGHNWCRTSFDQWEDDLDSLPFPDRNLIKNELYVRPDTGEAQATITTSRGCPSQCIFCVTPIISGFKLRMRSPQKIIEEMLECYNKYGIKNFFFKSDTFTFNQRWTCEVCEAILNSELAGKIEWVANSRVSPLSLETLQIMKKAGCWLIAFGFESGHPETLGLIRKNTSVEQNRQAAKWAKEAKLKTFGFFLVGLPWERREHLEATRQHIFELDCDFLELHIAVPYFGSPLYGIAQKEGLIADTVLGRDYFNTPTIGTKYLGIDEVEAFRRKTILRYHVRPMYIIRKLIQSGGSPKIVANYFRFGIRLLKNNLSKLFSHKTSA